MKPCTHASRRRTITGLWKLDIDVCATHPDGLRLGQRQRPTDNTNTEATSRCHVHRHDRLCARDVEWTQCGRGLYATACSDPSKTVGQQGSKAKRRVTCTGVWPVACQTCTQVWPVACQESRAPECGPLSVKSHLHVPECGSLPVKSYVHPSVAHLL